MAKNTGDTRFRKLDVDSFSQSNFEEETVDDTHLNPRDVEGLLSRQAFYALVFGKYEEALRMVLDNAPVNSKDAGLKDAVSALILRAMSSIRSNQVDAFVNSLNQEQLDMLMKYIYRGFQKPVDITYPALLVWHEKALAKGKISSICRVLTDRQVV
ncbi:Actin-related protein 2/3 complex subunit 5-like protein [Echinococcus granulosus]|uniref:Actin-related protein 2/3 complex subunit 5 n=1 Tax=Echinococcus granulosus TaxID=6210 RepID=U6JAB5_ECHGR|nr:Actin-related protein 2/3 complex subunit 5-like protein [Echinococcus granulosus]EUB57871.1 Actin-related protein 2/3 complex subunit 5-like protein [Echinococcus granulosus]KAH9278872.1 Actin-related protein 2/3 complex subunit 5-like protein [Echinococcus granulosus]CDS20974.1 Actin protein 2:3 complex subunit 5 [Echinococcus granulosus]